MRKLFLFFLLLIFTNAIHAEVIRGSVSEVKIPEGFWGSWHVTSKMVESNNSKIFNPISVDIWGLSGFDNILILTNEMTGATSQITVDRKNIQGLQLKFERTKLEKEGDIEIFYRETPEITLNGDIFQGYDTFYIEKRKNGFILEKNIVKYKVVGQKISGENGQNDK